MRQSGPCDPVSHFCLPQIIRSEWNLSNSVNQVYDLSPLFYFITPVHQISVVMLNLKVKRERKNNHLEKDKLHISGLVLRQSLKPLKIGVPNLPCAAASWAAHSECVVCLFIIQHAGKVITQVGLQKCRWADSAFQVSIFTFILSMCCIFLECLLTTSWGNSFSFG